MKAIKAQNFDIAGGSMTSTFFKACFSCGEDPSQIKEGRSIFYWVQHGIVGHVDDFVFNQYRLLSGMSDVEMGLEFSQSHIGWG